MTSHPTAPAPRRGALIHLGVLAQMIAMAVVGLAFFTTASTLFGVGLSTILLLGVGALFLVAFLYVGWAWAWLEYERVEGLYRLDLPRLRVRTSGRPGFAGFLRTLWVQFTDGAMWRGIASAAVTSLLGWLALACVGGFVGSIAALIPGAGEIRIPFTTLFTGGEWSILIGILGILLTAALLFGLSVLHGVVTRALLVPSREAQFLEQARAAGVQRESAVRASELERTRIERDLHDGVQPRLVSVGMTLGLAQQKIETDPAAAKALIDEAHTSTKAAITELRQLARGIHASVLDDRGLDAALSALAARSHVPVTLDVRMDGRCSRTAEAAVYFVIAESLTNAAKHARATQVRVLVRRRDDGTLWSRVEDDGIGGATVVPGGGLDGITNRILAAGGTARLESPVGGPTALEVSVPCAS